MTFYVKTSANECFAFADKKQYFAAILSHWRAVGGVMPNKNETLNSLICRNGHIRITRREARRGNASWATNGRCVWL